MLESLACLAMAIYFEARSEPIAGQLAVAQVILNRTTSNRFPDTPCEVVKQGPVRNSQPVRHKCQFSFWCDGKKETVRNHDAWQTAEEVARAAMIAPIDITEGATFYHTPDVSPAWRYTKSLTVQIGQHIFYKEK
jgi:spore germination cell wall hydrolase CwlJ-like protein